MSDLRTPQLTLEPVEEVALKSAPLDSVVFQVRFSHTPALAGAASDGRLDDGLRDYPVQRLAQSITGITVGPQGPMPSLGVVRQYLSLDSKWSISVSDTFVSLATSEYSSRDDFCERIEHILDVVCAAAKPPVVDRIGLRYTDRLYDEDALRADDFFVGPVVGLAGFLEDSIQLHHTITETQIETTAGEKVLVRSGLLPKGASVDEVIGPKDQVSWILDIDVSKEGASPVPFEASAITSAVRQFANIAYSTFRWATTPSFIDRFKD